MKANFLFVVTLSSIISLANAQTSPSTPVPVAEDTQPMWKTICPSAKRKLSAEEMQNFPTGAVINGWATSLRGEQKAQIGQPMPMRFIRINMTDKERVYNAHGAGGLFRITVKDAQGHILPITPMGEISLCYKTAGFMAFVSLKPEEGHEFTFDLNKFFDIKQAGDYTVIAFQYLNQPDPASPTGHKLVELLSNKMVISVR